MDRRSSIAIKDLEIRSFNIPHDAIAPVGYTVSSGGKNASVVTDFGVFTEEIRDNIIDSDIIFRILFKLTFIPLSAISPIILLSLWDRILII